MTDATARVAGTAPGGDAEAGAIPAPRHPTELFLAFSWLSLQGFGGVLSVVQRELVDRRRWLTEQGFVEDWAVAQVLPGPNVCNLALMFGDRHFGWRGALAALAGLLAVPLALVLALGTLYASSAGNPVVAGALQGMGAVAAGLIAGSAIKLWRALRAHPLGPVAASGVVVAAFLGAAAWRLPLHVVVLGLGGAACVATGWRLRRVQPLK